ncbi:MAG: hypothetical protein QOF61_2212, partial [Acidobacteriota bacterium]|nr:hypothetical protein [Acidobacteriota bacterium]
QRAEERVVFEPIGLATRERLEVRAQRDRGCVLEILEGATQEFILKLDRFAEINALLCETRRIGEIGFVEQTLFDEAGGRDEQSVSGEGGEALVRRVAVARGS